MTTPLVIQTEDLAPEPAAWLVERCRVVACPPEGADFPGLLAQASGLVVRTYTRVDETLLRGAPKLRVVGRAGVGLDNIDLGACAARGVTVVHTPDANSAAVSEYVLALMFDALRPRLFLHRALDKTEWCELRRELTARRQVCDLTMGVYGLGRIGQRVARAAGGLGMRTIYHDLVDIAPEHRWGSVPVGREELLSSADVLTIHVDGRPQNRHLINADALRHVRPDAVVINASRGHIVDGAAIADFARRNPSAAVLLDVHDPEPIRPDSPLLDLPNVQLSPHLAACTEPAHRNMGWVVKDVWRVLNGEQPACPAPTHAEIQTRSK